MKSFSEPARELFHRIRQNAILVGLFSLVWFILRTGTKPSRVVYPCQRVAAANTYMWITVCVLPFLLAVPKEISAKINKKKFIIIVLVAIVAGSAVLFGLNEIGKQPRYGLKVTEKLAKFQPSSSIFVMNGTSGNDEGVDELINLMGERGLLFYKSSETGKNKGSTGLIASNDVIIIKINSQWDERGGTNTDLVKALIQAIVNHPDGFKGEIIVADNGQAQFGPTNRGGSLNYSRNNAEDTSQSVQKVIDSFAGSYNVSTYLWDTITTKRVNEYSEGDIDDGYVVNTTANPRTRIMVSYPKFKTKFDTYVSFKRGIWNPQTQTYDSERLKVINVPVLKSHGGYGVTACVKHYMGVVSDKLTVQLGYRTHNTVGLGGMGTEMVETRFPTLNILDAIWVNAVPNAGPPTSFDDATRVNVIAASTDPVALDYWASKYILLQVAKLKGYSARALTTMDPNYTVPGYFGYWLRASMQEISRVGYQTTADEDYMNIYIGDLQTLQMRTQQN